GGEPAPSLPAVLRRERDDGPDAWVLVSGPDDRLAVNGWPVLGLRALTDRDEIRFAGRRLFFSARRLARGRPVPRVDRPRSPPRRQPLEVGRPGVCCPACGVWHHAIPELPCWTYAPRCSVCNQTTAEDAGFRWTPAEL